MESKTVYICDTATGRVRILVNPIGVADYLLNIGTMLKCFNITEKAEKNQEISVEVIIERLRNVHLFFAKLH